MDKIKELIESGELSFDDIEAYLDSIDKVIIDTEKYDELIYLMNSYPG